MLASEKKEPSNRKEKIREGVTVGRTTLEMSATPPADALYYPRGWPCRSDLRVFTGIPSVRSYHAKPFTLPTML